MTLTVAVAFALFAAATFAKLSVGKGKALFVSDGFYYYSYTVSLVLDRDLDFSNQYRFNKEWASSIYAYIVSKTGRPANQYGIGFGLLLLPAFASVHLGVLMAKTMGLPLTTAGYELYYELPTYLWSFLLGLLGMGLLYRLLAEVFDQRHAFWATVGILFGTALSNYAFLHANMSHWVSAACATAYLYSVFQVYRRPEDWRWWLVSGIGFGDGSDGALPKRRFRDADSRLVMATNSARAMANPGSGDRHSHRCHCCRLPAPNACLASGLRRASH